jgi:methionyl-tRNA formyltransferase
MDTGPVIDRASLPILATDTSASLHDKLALLGGEVLTRSLGGWVDGTLTAVPQQGAPVMAPMIEKEFGLIDFTASAALIERRMRAFTPWPGAFFKTAQGVVKVHGATVGTGHAAPGTVLRADPTGIELACGEGSLVITQLQAEGKRAMTAKEFLPGRKLEVGELWPLA